MYSTKWSDSKLNIDAKTGTSVRATNNKAETPTPQLIYLFVKNPNLKMESFNDLKLKTLNN